MNYALAKGHVSGVGEEKGKDICRIFENIL